MKTIEKTNGSKALDLTLAQPTNANHDGLSPMPEEFAGLYWSGYDAGYTSGRERVTAEVMRLVTPTAASMATLALTTAAAVPTNASGIRRPRRLLLGLPCPNCRIYSSTEEALCPCCKTPKVSAQNGRKQFAVTGDTSVSLKKHCSFNTANRH